MWKTRSVENAECGKRGVQRIDLNDDAFLLGRLAKS